jgi:hypothetical protein
VLCERLNGRRAAGDAFDIDLEVIVRPPSPAGGSTRCRRALHRRPRNFTNGSGCMIECTDGKYSMSGGRRGACSSHGGSTRPVYSGS